MKKHFVFKNLKYYVFLIKFIFLMLSNTSSFSQWIQISAPSTNSTVAVSDNGNGRDLAIFLTSTDNNIYYNTFDIDKRAIISTWQKATFPGSVPRNWFDSPPTSTSLGGELYVFARIRRFGNPTFNKSLPANTIFWAHTTNGQSKWTDWKPLPSGGRTNENMKAITWKNAIFLFSKGITDGKIYQNIYLNAQWTGWSIVADNSMVFSQGLAATATEDRLFLFGITNDGLAKVTSTGIKNNFTTDWSIWEPITGNGERFFSALTATNLANNQIQIFGIKYNSNTAFSGIGFIENDFEIPDPNILIPYWLPKWKGWKKLNEKSKINLSVFNPLSVSADFTNTNNRFFFWVQKNKLFFSNQ